MGAGVWVTMVEGIRERPVLILCGAVFLIFNVSPLYYSETGTLSIPALCENGSCQWESSDLASLSLLNVETNPDNWYLVNSTGCKLMDMDPLHPSAANLLKQGKAYQCDHRIAEVQDDKLIIDKEFLQSLKWESVSCCYRSIYRVDQSPTDYNNSADKQIKFSEDCQEVPLTPEGSSVEGSPFFKLECNGTDENGEPQGLVEFHGIPLHPKKHSEETRKKAGYWNERNEKGLRKPPSILVIGIDSTSRLHMIRSMPKTRGFLLQNDFVELKGYTKVGDNTFPNIMAGFGGMELDNYSSCWPKSSTKFDDCPFIWKDFRKLDYLTGKFEDSPNIAIFNYGKIGFVLPPADYYLRPLAIAFTRHFYNKKQEYCAGGVNVTDFIAKFIKELVMKMGRDYPYFFFSWFTSVSHDDFNGVGTADKTFLDLFQTAMDNSTGDPDNTVIIFMSDHGYRFGKIRETFLGFYEESLPFFYFRLPPSMKSKNPEWYSNLRSNSNQLTTPLDLHSTLAQILAVAQSTLASNSSTPPSDLRQNKNQQFDKERYSFLEQIPENRTCEISSVPHRYCMCGVTPEVSSDSDLSQQLGNVVVSNINSLLQNNSDICQPLKFSKFLYGRELGSGQRWNKFGQVISYKEYVLALEALPGKGHFEAKIRVSQDSASKILGGIERINSYGGQSDCIDEFSLKSYCYCKKKKGRNGSGSLINLNRFLPVVIMMNINDYAS